MPIFPIEEQVLGIYQNVNLCGGKIEVDFGVIQIGDENRDAHVLVEHKGVLTTGNAYDLGQIIVNNNSTITIGNGGLLHLYRKGQLVLNDNSKLIIESGGTLLIEEEGLLNLLASSQLEIKNGSFICINDFATNVDLHGRGIGAIDLEPHTPGINPALNITTTNNCSAIDGLFFYDYQVSLVNTKVPVCADPSYEFSVQTQGPAIPQDAQVCWFLPDTWIGNDPNCAFYSTRMSGTTNNYQLGDMTGGEVKVMIKSPLGFQQLETTVDQLQDPIITSPTNADVFICRPNDVDDDGNPIIKTIEINAFGGADPYTFQWENTGSLNFTTTEDGYQHVATLATSQPTRQPQEIQMRATDQNGCVSDPLKFTVFPSGNSWYFSQLSRKEYFQKGLFGSESRNNIVTDEATNIYFTGSDGTIYYYYWDLPAGEPEDSPFGLWKIASTGIINSQGALGLYEDANTVYFYYKATDNCVRTFTLDKATQSFSSHSVYANCPTNVKDIIHVTEEHHVYYQNMYDQLVRLLPDGNNYIYSTSFPVHGFNMVSKNGRIYYKSYQNVGVMDENLGLTGIQSTIAAEVANHSYLAINENEEVFYTTYDNTIKYVYRQADGTYHPQTAIPYQNNVNSEYSGSNGQLTINPISGVLYYIGWNSVVYQLYKDNNDEWLSANISVGGVGDTKQGAILYDSPHLLYFGGENHVYNSFYYPNNGCSAIIEKKGIGEGGLSVYPNPASEELFVSFNADEEDEISIQLFDVLGNLAVSEVEVLTSSGNYQISMSLHGINTGTYICRVLINEKEVAYKQVAVVH